MTNIQWCTRSCVPLIVILCCSPHFETFCSGHVKNVDVLKYCCFMVSELLSKTITFHDVRIYPGDCHTILGRPLKVCNHLVKNLTDYLHNQSPPQLCLHKIEGYIHVLRPNLIPMPPPELILQSYSNTYD